MGLREIPSRSRVAAAKGGTAFISVKESDRPAALEVVRQLQRLGFTIQATQWNGGVFARAMGCMRKP